MSMESPFGRASACEKAAHAISARLDGELFELEHLQLRMHLDGCATCRALESELVAFTHELRAAPFVVPARALVIPRLRGSRVRSLRPLAAAAAMIFVVVGSVGSLSRSGLQPQQTAPRHAIDARQYGVNAQERVGHAITRQFQAAAARERLASLPIPRRTSS